MVDVAEMLGAGGAYLSEEAPDHARMSNDGLRRQPTFSPQIVAELREYLVLWSDPRWLRWRDDTSIAQHSQHRLCFRQNSTVGTSTIGARRITGVEALRSRTTRRSMGSIE